MFVISVELTRHFHLSSLCFDAALSLFPFPFYIKMPQRVVYTGWLWKKSAKTDKVSQWSTTLLNSYFVFKSLANYLQLWSIDAVYAAVATRMNWSSFAPWDMAVYARGSFIFTVLVGHLISINWLFLEGLGFVTTEQCVAINWLTRWGIDTF